MMEKLGQLINNDYYNMEKEQFENKAENVTKTTKKEVKVTVVPKESKFVTAETIKLVRGEWNKQFVDQLLNFPNSAVHDDLIDALAYIDQIGITEFTDMIEEEEYEALDEISGY